MAGTEAPSSLVDMKAPSPSDLPMDGSESGPGPASQRKEKGKRLSSTSQFLQNIFCRFIPPFSPNSKPSSPSPTSLPTVDTTTTATNSPQPTQPPQQLQPPPLPKDTEMAASPARSREPSPLASFGHAPTPAAPENSDRESPRKASIDIAGTPAAALGRMSLESTGRPWSSASIPQTTLTPPGERPTHQAFMGQALDMARLALRTNETPVGCVLVHNGSVIARGMNATNVTRNGTRHAEFMALSALLSYRSSNIEEAVDAQLRQQASERSRADVLDDESNLFPMDDDYVRKGHLYPYGQKLYRTTRVERSIVRECTLYVTVEPCVMCASLLRQLGIKKVYFGAVNDKFGGTGGVFGIHKNSTDIRQDPNPVTVLRPLQTSTNACNLPRPVSSSSGKTSLNNGRLTSQGGDGGNVEPGFEAEGGWGRDEAVSLLRRFYVQENGRAPVPRKKEGRAARLAAMEQAGSDAGTPLPPQPSDGDADEGNDACNGDIAALNENDDTIKT
ncbi:trna-specific adenosine deaminase subunit tad2 [Colletotrichum incanum]|uniref:Trna-specific adenosine deaminase subunit tad2 n=1 Tax=Colletotrichum incanum TaxID=1573173 RepID=A0A167CW24_COLIC|nr:trna-specific adenosine deaminase subunit tad2 [Colletotrichum incanum]OHW90411.1 tRNA-specific adenosine deaminase subunit tad2 [Colletotrichum incanum]